MTTQVLEKEKEKDITITSSDITSNSTSSNSIQQKQKKKSQGKFRIAAKKLFLTYSQVPEQLTSHEVYLQLQNKLHIQNYVIAREKHQDGGFHFHAVLTLTKKCNITSQKTLDIRFQNKSFHGNYAPVRCIKQSIAYLCKDNQYITNFTNVKDGKLLSIPEEIIHIFEQKGKQQALTHYLKTYPEHAFGTKGFSNAKRLFHNIEQVQETEPTIPESPFTLDDFYIDPKIQEWIDNGGQPTLLLAGEAGCGKTALVKTIAKHFGWKTLTITNIDGLKQLTPEHDLLFMDDIAGLDKIHPQKLLALFETADPKNIRVSYDNITKPANLKQIIALNFDAIYDIKDKLKTRQMLRRFSIVHIDKPILVNINSDNRTIYNNHAHIHNNEERSEDNRLVLKQFPYTNTRNTFSSYGYGNFDRFAS